MQLRDCENGAFVPGDGCCSIIAYKNCNINVNRTSVRLMSEVLIFTVY